MESDFKVVVWIVIRFMNGDNVSFIDERLCEVEVVCKCVESWIDWGLGVE